ncbi:MAG: ArsR family transcriptional regulator [Candidatus Dojkabacteria bacterium]
MITDTRKRLLEYIAQKQEVTVNELVSNFGFTQAAIHRQLNKLLESREVVKLGTPPRVLYRINSTKNDILSVGNEIADKAMDVINDHFIYISPLGKIFRGFEGLIKWCTKFDLKVEKTAGEYIKTLDKYGIFKNSAGLIDGTEKLRNTFPELYLSKVFYLDFYSIERFGKTKLGALVLYAKQSQNRMFMKEVAELSQDRIKNVISDQKIDAVCFIPHTLPRKVQFMNEVEKYLNLNLPKIKLIKVINDIPVAQKTLNKLSDRVENASNTIFLKDSGKYDSVLLIDDAIGSGATMNESAKKLKEKGIAQEVIGLALTGSYKGFEVLNEV